MTGQSLIRVLRIAPADFSPPQSWSGYSTSLATATESLAMATVALSKEVLQRPQVLPEGSPHQHVGSGHSRQAARIGMLAWQEMREGRGVMSSQLINDASGIADKIAVVKLPACPEAGTRPATCALLLASRSNDVVLLPHERPVSTPAQRSAVSPSGESTICEQPQCSAEGEERTLAAAEALGDMFGMSSADSKAAHETARQSRNADANGEDVPGCPIVWVIWAESFRDASPSLLLGYALLTSRRESALFLRMATGFGFAQLGDYSGSLLYRLGKRGHRFKCWECGVKKKAPCGDTHRPDLPWCCHRRLGAHIACLAAAFTNDSVTLQGDQTSFVPLLPPKETTVISSTQALDFQLGYRPVPTAVVAFSELLSRTGVHPAESINTALGRLSPTCRALWSTHWPTQKRLAALAGDEVAAQELHFWLEKTAYFKMPKGQEQELIGSKRSSLEKLVAEAVPHVEGAPCLGGHNRAELPTEISTPEAAAAYLETLSAPPDSHRRNANTGQGRRRLNARAALRQQERSSSPAPSLGRPASAGEMPEPSGQQLGCPQGQHLPMARLGSAGLERTRFLPSRSARPKPLACEPDSGEEGVSPASPDQAPQEARRSSPSGLNDMEMEVANELRALQRGVPSTTGRQTSASWPLSEVPASRENSMPRSPAPSSPDIARPPKKMRSSVSKRRMAAISGLPENPGSYRFSISSGKQRGVASWQQQGAGLRAPDLAFKKPRLSCSPQKVMHVELEQEERRPLRDIAFSRQPSSNLPADAGPKQMPAGLPQHCGRSEPPQENWARSVSGTLPRAGHGGQPEQSFGLASERPRSAQKHPDVPEQGRGQAKAKQPAGALPVVVMSPLQLGHVNSCLTLPSELSSKVLAGQLQVLISGHVTLRQAPTLAHTESLGSLLSQVTAHVQGSVPVPDLALAATHTQGMPVSTLAPKVGSELAPQPAKKVVTQQGSILPVISAGMLRQQIRHLQALQKHQQGARSGSMPLPASESAALVKNASLQQQPAGAVAPEQARPLATMQQQPPQSTPEAHGVSLARAGASIAELHPSIPPSGDASQQPGFHSLKHSTGGAVGQMSAQGAHASAAQASAASAACSNSGGDQHSAFITAVSRQPEALPISAALVPRPPTHDGQPGCPAARLSHSTCHPASGLAAGHDSSAEARSMSGHSNPGWVCRPAFAQASCMVVHPQKPGQMLSHVSIQPSLIAPHSGDVGTAVKPWEVFGQGGMLGCADAAVTVQLVPGIKPAAGSTKLTEKAQETSQALPPAALKAFGDVDMH